MTSLMSLSAFFIINTADAKTFHFWNNLMLGTLVFIPILQLYYAIAFIGKGSLISKFHFILLCYTPAFIFLYLLWKTDLIEVNDITRAILSEWGYTIKPGPFFNLFILYHLSFYIPTYFLIARFYNQVQNKLKKRQTILIILAMSIPTIGGVVFQGILPSFFGFPSFPAAAPLVTITALIISYAITKYGVYIFNPLNLTSTLLQTISEAVVTFNTSYQIEYLNPAAQNLLGVSKQQLIGSPLRKIFSSDGSYHEIIKEAADPLSNTYTRLRESQILTPGLKTIPVSYSATKIIGENKENLGYILVLSDITSIKAYTKRLENIQLELEEKVKQRTKKLSAEKDKLELILSGITDAVIAVDMGRNIITFNKAAAILTGYTDWEAIGRPIDEVIEVYNQNQLLQPLFYCPLPDNKDIPFLNKELKIKGKNKKESYITMISGLIKEGTEANIGCILTLHDISKDKELERMKLDFVSMAAHQLRTPLTSIRGYLYLLQKALESNSNPKNYLERAIISSKQLSDLTQNLLSVAKIERGIFDIRIEPVEWVNVVQNIVTEFTQHSQTKKQTLRFIPPQDLYTVLVDKEAIGKALTNLLSNAINYTPEGGYIKISLEAKDGYVITRIKDTGIGIPSQFIDHIFTKFFRISAPLMAGDKGTGLGLYTAKSIIELHQGKIWVESEPGKGSTFSFSLPIARD